MKHTKSDSQANAEALARRSSTYADANARSLAVRFDRPSMQPKNLAGYVKELRYAYEAEMPERMHRHDVDGGGTPAFSAEMSALLYGSPYATDDEDFYRYPVRACIRRMGRHGSEELTLRARIVFRIVSGHNAIEAAIAEGILPGAAKVVALDALRVAWTQISAAPLPRSVTAA